MTRRGITGILIAVAFFIAAGIPAVSAEDVSVDTVAVEKIDLYNLAVDEAGAGNYSTAMEHIDAALAIDGNFTLAWVTKAGISSAQGDYAGALTAGKAAIALNQNQTEAWVVSADALVNLGRYDEAVVAADKAIALNPDMIEAYIIQGTAYGQMGEYEKEIAVSQKALEINPDDVRAQGNLHFAQANVGDAVTPSEPTEAPFPAAGAVLGAGVLFLMSRRWYR
ncbi:tetratricopeptide repeat protein [Methanogenium organophilum]|uniref:Tetratricopeptide repeat protein n=1 Tax=Methanogenium organophilum TaxID=2199 RepID=A0A9X9S4N3_METOG|nr:tetratricopeptide repeat protein [Methanogenium organophilum]WAI01461.1 tetratricopeptide repeat protein [Methanogenium organophilum]